MIKIDARGTEFAAKLDISHEFYARAYLLLRSLLSAKGAEPDVYTLSYIDLLALKKKLDSMGLVNGRTMTKAALTLIKDYQASEKRNNDIKKGIHNELVEKSLEGKLKTVPYADQITGISYCTQNRRSGLFDAMGVGKSLESLGTLASLGPKVRKTLIICPKSVVLGFGREIELHTYFKFVAIPPGRKASLDFLKKHKTGNWDIMLVHPENLISSSKQAVYGDVTKLLKTMKFDMVIVDEWHMYKNDDAKRSKCVLSLLAELRDREARPPRAILMTGTPVSESPMNAYVTLKVLSSEHLPNISRFETYFTHKEKKTMTLKPKRGVNGKKGRRARQISFDKVVGYKNLGELKARLEAVSIRRTKEDMVGFPDKTTIIRDVILSGNQLKLYKAVCNEIIADLSSSSKINLAKFFADSAKTVRLRQLLNHPQFIDETCESAKYLELDSILEEVLSDPEQKVIIWSEYRRAIDFIYDRWNALYGVVKIRGGVEIDDALAQSFEYDPKIRIAAAIPAKAGTGMDFLARARTAIYIDRPYSYTQYAQSLDRIHRRVKTVGELTWLDRMRSQPATVIFLDVVGSLDELVREKLEGKGDIADALTVEDKKLLSIGKAELLRYLR